MAAVELADAAQAAQHIGNVGTEDATVHVGLIYHDVPEVGKEPGPQLVVGKDAHVEHVGVRKQDIGRGPDGGPVLGRSIPVIGGVPGLAAQVRGQCAQTPHLVLGQGLGGIQVEGRAFSVLEHCLQNGDVIAEALAAGRRRGDDHMLAFQDGINGLGLVAIEGPEAQPSESGH
jgi:hypothetical protein